MKDDITRVICVSGRRRQIRRLEDNLQQKNERATRYVAVTDQYLRVSDRVTALQSYNDVTTLMDDYQDAKEYDGCVALFPAYKSLIDRLETVYNVREKDRREK